MANSSEFLLTPQPLALTDGYNSFVSNWGNKRSSLACGISVVFYRGGSDFPDGYTILETSNAPEAQGTSYGMPANAADDAQVVPGSQVTVILNPTTGLYGVQYAISNIAAHFIRVRYVQNTGKTKLSANVYYNAPFNSN